MSSVARRYMLVQGLAGIVAAAPAPVAAPASALDAALGNLAAAGLTA